ncbi:tyrosine-type recombinase/integrase [Streptomyces sp. NPDC090499]|uniref:tyrosine-type recombinase/integrase n=1 Tax=Streptomyces sp. NPDC090499 TaxID=3365965 RepID=UPI00381AEC1C
MAQNSLPRGMGSFFKECGHPQSRWAKCPHPYAIRYRSAAGKQVEESGFANKDLAIERLTEVYKEKKTAKQGQPRAERIRRYGAMRFADYAEEWKAGQRHLAVQSVKHLDSLLEHHLYPALGSRRMNSFDHKVVDGFIRTMERNGAGLATQSNAFDKLRAILLDAQRLGIFPENPVAGVKAPQYDPARAVIPSPEQLRGIRTAGDDAFMLIVDLMSGCGLRNGEAAAVNLDNIVADDVYRVSEQVIMATRQYGPLKHRKPREYRDVPLPVRVRETIEWYAEKHGTVDGYLLRQATDPSRPYQHYAMDNQWRRIRAAGTVDVPEGMVLYGNRHFFASNCLSNGIPITDVAEWMGHRSIDVTFKIYRHLMPGSISSAAQLLNVGLAA